jgi:hypothetical protein
MNPVEDEAVVGSVARELGGAVRIVDVSERFPGLKRSKGLRRWNVELDGKVYPSFGEVPEELRRTLRETVFPAEECEGIENCQRFYPHQNDTGGFFLAVLEKVAAFDVRVQQSQAQPKPWKEPAFIQLVQAPNGAAIFQDCLAAFGMDGRLKPDNLFARESSVVKCVFYLSDGVASIVTAMPPRSLRAVSCGSRFFASKSLDDATAVKIFPCFEGIKLFATLATRRVLLLEPVDVLKILTSEGSPLADLSEAAREQLDRESNGGLIVRVQATDIAYGAMKGVTALTLLIKKERIPEERFKLVQLFPSLAESLNPANVT